MTARHFAVDFVCPDGAREERRFRAATRADAILAAMRWRDAYFSDDEMVSIRNPREVDPC